VPKDTVQCVFKEVRKEARLQPDFLTIVVAVVVVTEVVEDSLASKAHVVVKVGDSCVCC
jgi:hypothetical protein